MYKAGRGVFASQKFSLWGGGRNRRNPKTTNNDFVKNSGVCVMYWREATKKPSRSLKSQYSFRAIPNSIFFIPIYGSAGFPPFITVKTLRTPCFPPFEHRPQKHEYHRQKVKCNRCGRPIIESRHKRSAFCALDLESLQFNDSLESLQVNDSLGSLQFNDSIRWGKIAPPSL